MKTKITKRIFLLTMILLGYVLGLITHGLVNAQDLGEGYGYEMEYVNTLQGINEAVYMKDHEEYNKLVHKLTGLAHTIADYNCGQFNGIKYKICRQNKLHDLTFIPFKTDTGNN